MGFYLLKTDNAIYRNPIIKIIIPTHIDNFLIIGKKLIITKTKAGLNKTFYIKDLDPVKHFINVRIIRDRVNKTISLV